MAPLAKQQKPQESKKPLEKSKSTSFAKFAFHVWHRSRAAMPMRMASWQLLASSSRHTQVLVYRYPEDSL